MFLDAYKRNWLETEGYSFEDQMIDDLSVRYIPLNWRCRVVCVTVCTDVLSCKYIESIGGRGRRGGGDREEA